MCACRLPRASGGGPLLPRRVDHESIGTVRFRLINSVASTPHSALRFGVLGPLQMSANDTTCHWARQSSGRCWLRC